MRELIRLGASAVLLLAIMLAGGVVLWVGIPLAWLWIGSQIEGSTQSLDLALAAMMVGVLASIFAFFPVLNLLSEAYRRQRLARGLQDTGHFALEVVMVLSATAAAVCFTAWFLLFAGSSPIPVGISF
ncbi:MAG: hypothetical protein ACR2HD_08280 [Solirubrobacteraceae bacterium]|nr:MAG: hypothetical protein DLM63_05730 [Solirubrobacterales bacterium]